jgi:hypothetical protein
MLDYNNFRNLPFVDFQCDRSCHGRDRQTGRKWNSSIREKLFEQLANLSNIEMKSKQRN